MTDNVVSSPSEFWGESAVMVGDVDENGHEDVLVMSHRNGVSSIFFFSLFLLDGSGLLSATSFSYFGFSASPPLTPGMIIVEDLDGDGRPELLVSNRGKR